MTELQRWRLHSRLKPAQGVAPAELANATPAGRGLISGVADASAHQACEHSDGVARAAAA